MTVWKRNVWLTLWVLAVAPALAACGDDDDDDNGDTTGDTTGGGTDTGSTTTGGTDTATDTGTDTGTGTETTGTDTADTGDTGTDTADTGDTGDTTDTGSNELRGCNPIVPEECLLPFPSNHWTRPDANSPTGLRLAFAQEGFLKYPEKAGGKSLWNEEYNRLDGFSTTPMIVTHLPGAVLTGVADQDTIALSLEADSKTILLDAETGDRVPHWAELDASPRKAGDTSAQVLIVRAISHLKEGHRYIVAFRNITDAGGQAVAPSAPFKALRDKTADASVDNLRDAYEDIFEKLNTAGVERATVQQAFDFTTMSGETVRGRLLRIYDDAVTRYTGYIDQWKKKTLAGVPLVDVDLSSLKVNENENTLFRVEGTFRVPLYVKSEPINGGSGSATPGEPPARFVLDENGNPNYINEDVTARFYMVVPKSALGGGKSRLVQYGHGLFGEGGEVNVGYLREMSQRYNTIFFATDWWGMAGDDQGPLAALATNDFGRFPVLPDRLAQGVVNAGLLGELFASNVIMEDERLKAAVAEALKGSADEGKYPEADTDHLFYYGNSQGGIAGVVYGGVSTRIEKAVLGVGGGPYSVLLERSADFKAFDTLLRRNFNNAEMMILLKVVQMLWDRSEPSAWFRAFEPGNALPGRPEKKALLQYGMNDHQVSNLGTHINGRSIGAVQVAPNNGAIYGFEQKTLAGDETYDGNAMVDMDCLVAPVPKQNIPPFEGEDSHECPRRARPLQDQLDFFLRPDGKVKNFCDGPCKSVK